VFAAIDDAPRSAGPAWVHADAQRAEAGFEDPALGWVAVRANVDGGSVHASLVGATVDAAFALSGHLDGLNQYLGRNHAEIAPVTVSSSENHAWDGGMSGGTGGNSTGGGSQGSPDSWRASRSEEGFVSTPVANSEELPAIVAAQSLVRPIGVRISVMA
jgi:hypothetical protein